MPPEKKSKVPIQKIPMSWVWLALFIMFAASTYYSSQNQEILPYNQFVQLLEQNQIKQVTIDEDKLVAKRNDDKKTVISYKVEDENLIPLLKEKGIEFQGVPDSQFWTILIWLLPLFFFFYLMRNMANMQGHRMLGFNKSKAKIYVQKDIPTRFTDIAGVDEAKDELLEVINFLREPKTYSRLGGRVPTGILLIGPPGTGKTLMAKAVAGEARVPFFSINGSEFVELFVGMGAARVRDLFEQARKQSPCIIFIDELDALGKSRSLGSMSGGTNDEKEQTLNQLLAELDGFDSRSGVVLLAATNRPEILDPALLRAGRFDRQVLLDNPDRQGRTQILQIHSQKVKLEEGTELEEIAALTPGFSGADLANLVNEAALVATRRNAEAVEKVDFVNAIERIVAGLERKQRLINPEEKKRVAYHEMGHVTVSLALGVRDKVQKVSVIPRGIAALGYTLQRPIEDRYLVSKKELLNKISGLLGGRVAEQFFCEDISTGAGDDLVKATNIARAMVTEYGMGTSLGLLSESNDSRFLAMPQQPKQRTSQWSDSTGEKVDKEIKQILEDCRLQAHSTIEQNKEFIKASVQQLLGKETLETEQIEKLWSAHGHKLSSNDQ